MGVWIAALAVVLSPWVASGADRMVICEEFTATS